MFWRQPRDTRIVIIVLGLDLPGYLRVLDGGALDLLAVVEESGHRCGRCGGSACARRHAVRHRKRVTDIASGAAFDHLPIVRVRFCDRRTVSLMPGGLWRGRCAVDSVLKTVVRLFRDGLEAAYDWTWTVGRGEEMVSQRTLGRWRDIVERRLIGSAFAWLGPELSITWSSTGDPASQLESLLAQLMDPVLVRFRAATGRAVLDKAPAHRTPARTRARRLQAGHAPSSSPNPPSEWRRRGAWSRPRRRDPPAAGIPEDKDED